MLCVDSTHHWFVDDNQPDAGDTALPYGGDTNLLCPTIHLVLIVNSHIEQAFFKTKYTMTVGLFFAL